MVCRCPHCGKQFKVPASAKGRKARCKACLQLFRLEVTEQHPSAAHTSTQVADASCGKKTVTVAAGSWQCPNCGAVHPREHRICTACGYDRKSKTQISTAFGVESQKGFDQSPTLTKTTIMLAAGGVCGVLLVGWIWFLRPSTEQPDATAQMASPAPVQTAPSSPELVQTVESSQTPAKSIESSHAVVQTTRPSDTPKDRKPASEGLSEQCVMVMHQAQALAHQGQLEEAHRQLAALRDEFNRRSSHTVDMVQYEQVAWLTDALRLPLCRQRLERLEMTAKQDQWLEFELLRDDFRECLYPQYSDGSPRELEQDWVEALQHVGVQADEIEKGYSEIRGRYEKLKLPLVGEDLLLLARKAHDKGHNEIATSLYTSLIVRDTDAERVQAARQAIFEIDMALVRKCQGRIFVLYTAIDCPLCEVLRAAGFEVGSRWSRESPVTLESCDLIIISKSVRVDRQLCERLGELDKKIIGIGHESAAFFKANDLHIGKSIWHNKHDQGGARVAWPIEAPGFQEILSEPCRICSQPPDKYESITLINSHHETPSIGVYLKQPVPEVTGIAMENRDDEHWIISVEGNYLLWGAETIFMYDPVPDRGPKSCQVTKRGLQLFLNICDAFIKRE